MKLNNHDLASFHGLIMFDTHISAAPPNSSMWTHMWQPCRKRFTFWVAKCLGRPTSPSKSSKCSISDHVSPTQTIPWQARIGRAEYMIGLDIFDDIFTVYTYVTKRYISQNQTIPKGCPEKSDYIGRHIMTHLSWYLFLQVYHPWSFPMISDIKWFDIKSNSRDV